MDTYGWFSGYSWVSMAYNLHQLGSSPYNYGETSPLFNRNCAPKLCPGFKLGRPSWQIMFGVFIMLLVLIGNKYQHIANMYIYIYTHVFAVYIYIQTYYRWYIIIIYYYYTLVVCIWGPYLWNKWSKWAWHIFFFQVNLGLRFKQPVTSSWQMIEGQWMGQSLSFEAYSAKYASAFYGPGSLELWLEPIHPKPWFFDVKGPSGVRKQRSYVGVEFFCEYGIRAIYKEWLYTTYLLFVPLWIIQDIESREWLGWHFRNCIWLKQHSYSVATLNRTNKATIFNCSGQR